MSFLSSVSCPSKLIEPKEQVLGTSDLVTSSEVKVTPGLGIDDLSWRGVTGTFTL